MGKICPIMELDVTSLKIQRINGNRVVIKKNRALCQNVGKHL